MALNMATASHFPSTSSSGRAGVINSGSSDCLSRSPAVTSNAIAIPPITAAKSP